MADITNPEAVQFCNARLRPAADKLAQLYFAAKQVQGEWFANSLGDLIVYNNPGLVVDGSAEDGRHPISGIDANNLMTRLSEFTADMEAGSNAKLNTVLAVAVNY